MPSKAGCFEVIAAEDGLAALKVSSLLPSIDLVVTDIQMPRMNGIDLSLAIAKDFPSTAVLFVTGESNAAPPGPVLFKPFRVDELARALSLLEV